jgi:hypothetical protein
MASKTLTWQHFFGIMAPRVCLVEENLFAVFMETQTLPEWTNFSFQTYTNLQSLQFVYFKGLLPSPLEKSLSKVLPIRQP